MKFLNKIFFCLAIYSISFEAFAHKQNSVLISILLNIAPLVVIIVVWIILIRVYGKKTSSINERIVESNEQVALQVKRIADHLEKNS